MIPDLNSDAFLQAISVEQMQKSDSYTTQNLIPGRDLMYRAAMGVFENVVWKDKRIAIICGSGNNAGDGYALASILKDNGYTSTIFLTSNKFSEDGSYYYSITKRQGIPSFVCNKDSDFSEYDILVDCILGTGFKGVPRKETAIIIKKINEAGKYVVCVDINSGLNGDTGEAVLAVRSDLTISIGYYKKGLFLGKAPKLIGNLMNIDIGIVLVT